MTVIDYKEVRHLSAKERPPFTSCLTLSFLLATIAHLTSSNVSSSYKEVNKCGRRRRKYYLQLLYRICVDNYSNISVFRRPCFLQEASNLSQTVSGGSKPRVNKHTSPSIVFSNRPFTIRADGSLSAVTSLQLIIGVLIFLEALIISLIRGTPRVTFMDATPAKWKVFSVI